jgi:catechol 2,3-dioxygenase-like lactoylglutathione lyase family enzyme
MLTSKIKRSNTILYCRNWEVTVKFYRDVLKFSINHESEWFVEFQLANGTYLSIANEENASIKCAGGRGITLSWQIEGVEKIHRRLNRLGINVSRIKRIWGSQAFYLFDPEGHRLELWS